MLVSERSIAFSLGLDPVIEDLDHPAIEQALSLGASGRGVERCVGKKPIEFRDESVGDGTIFGAEPFSNLPTGFALIRWVRSERMAEVHD
jgi:hypothetical protein